MDQKKQRPAQVTKRCHWVPQAYLKAFAADEKRTKIWRLSNKEGDPELKPIEKVAVAFHLYVPLDPVTKKRDDAFEHKLAELERWFDSPQWKSLQTGMVNLSSDPMRKMVSLLTATMMLRNPRHFEMHKSTHAKFRSAILAAGQIPEAVQHKGKIRKLDPESWEGFRDATEDDLKRGWIEEMNNAAWFAKLLMKMRWSVLCSEKPAFITTDAPVTFHHPSLEFRGIKDKETVILFPISPTRLLCMDNMLSEPASRYYQLSGDGSVQNLLLWRNALEHMFTHRDPDEVCAELDAEAQRQGFGQHS